MAMTIESYPDAAKQVFDEGHEIAHHGWTHMPPAAWSRDDEEADLARANETIRLSPSAFLAAIGRPRGTCSSTGSSTAAA